MSQNEPNPPDRTADTASFQRFMEQEQEADRGPVETGGSSGNRFRLLTLAIAAVVLIVVVVLLLQSGG
jgi:hypothetical protein